MLSIIIPVRNGAATLKRCLQSIRNQTMQEIEIIVLDSMSTDSSRQIAEQFGAQIVDIPDGTFDHGLARNMCVQQAARNLIFFTVQDAWISEPDILERMAAHFDDPEVMAVCGHQAVPHEKDKNPVRWYRRYSDHAVEVRQVNDEEFFKKLPQASQQKLVAWDNVVAMYRKEALEELPFVQTEMSEDWVWSYQALLNGWKLLRDSSLVVYHYHHQTPGYVFRTNWSINYHFYKFFGYRPELPALMMPALRSIYHLAKSRDLSLKEKVYWSIHNVLWRASECHAALSFRWKLFFGKAAVDSGYQKYCREIPQGKQRVK